MASFALMLANDAGRTVEVVTLDTGRTVIDRPLETRGTVSMTWFASWVNRVIRILILRSWTVRYTRSSITIVTSIEHPCGISVISMFVLVQKVSYSIFDGVVAIIMGCDITSAALLAAWHEPVTDRSLEAFHSSGTLVIIIAVTLTLTTLVGLGARRCPIYKIYQSRIITEIMGVNIIITSDDTTWHLGGSQASLKATKISKALIITVAFTFTLVT
jgi:hypothetical protein